MTPGAEPRPEVPRILAGSPTDDETAALAAVFALLAAERAAATVVLEPAPTGWARGAETLREAWPVDGGWR